MKTKNYTFINLLKVTAMFMVINYHCILFFSGDPYWVISADYSNDVCIFLTNFFSVAVNATFVFSSGFLLEVTLSKREYKTLELIRKKGERLIKTYFVYGLIWLVPTYTLFNIPSYGRVQNASLFEGYKAMLLGQFCDVSWFLLMLFWVTLIFVFIRNYIKKDKLIIGAALTFILTVVCKYALMNISYYNLNQIYTFIPVYFAGIVFYHLIDKFNKTNNKMLVFISIFGLILCVLLSQNVNELLDCVLHVLSPFFLALLSLCVCRHKEIENRFIDWIIKNNLYIYLLQMPGLYLIFGYLYPIIGQNALLCVFLCYVFTILQDYLLVKLLNIILNFLKRKKA